MDGKPYSRTMKIDPATAKKWLVANYGNRPMLESHIARLGKQMTQGEWTLVPDAIAFAPNGRLINGQHRLQALLNTGVTCEFMVAWNMPEEAFDVTDTQKVKSGGDALACAGEDKYRNELAAALRIVARWELGDMGQQGRFTNREVVHLNERHPELREFVYKWNSRNIPKGTMSGSQFAALDYIFSMKDPVLASAFLEEVRNGEGLRGNDPSFVLRARLADLRFRGGKEMARYVLALTVKAWNLLRKNRPANQLSFKDGEAFPTII
jgi:hypothetical protein